MTSSSEAPAKPAAAAPSLALRKLGKYEFQKQLGAGGMGAVYLAKDVQLKRLVALKILPQDKAKNATLVRRFMAEAQAAAQLRHDHIVAVYENGEADGHQFIAMEYVDGTDLHELIRKRGKIPVKRSLEIVKQVALALQHAYEHSIVHRDIKPSNLLIRNDGVVKLTDLGLARSVDDTLETDITRAGTTVGTVDYMSPEQGRSSKSADIRSDIYSLGCTWYHMLTGKPPYPEGSLTNKLQAHATKSLPNPRDLNDAVPEALVAVLQRMMAKRPQDRHQTPEELLKDLASPSLMRAGGVHEVLTSMEDADETAETPKAAKRGLPPGMLPPKKEAAKTEEEDKPSWMDWETLQPLVFGAIVLAAIAGLGTIVAYFSGGLDFGSGKIVKPDNDLMPNSGDVLQSPPNKTPAGQQSQPVNNQPDTQLLVSPESPNLNPDGTPATTPPGAEGSTNPQTVVSPNTPTAPDGTKPPNSPTTPGTTPGSVAQASPNLNAEEIPDWSATPSLRAQNSGSPGTTPNASGNPNPSGTPGTNPPKTTNPANPSGTPNTSGSNPSGKGTAPGTRPGTTPAVPVVASLKQFTVGPGAATAGHFRNLTDALKAIPQDGGVITLTGPGPFALPQVSLRQIRRVVLLASDGPQPIILVRPAAGELTAGLQLAEGVLEMEGLHFAVDRSAFAGSDPVSIVSSVDGQLTVRQCGFSVWGAGTVPVEAIRCDSQTEPRGMSSILEPRVLIDQVLVKGNDVTALAIARATADVVVRESLFVCGRQPALDISGKLPELLAGAAGSKPRRAIRLLQSTLFGNRAVVQASADGAAIPPSTAVLLQESVCATAGAADEARLVNAAAWPAVQGDAAGGKLRNLSWTMKDSVALGFTRLAELDPAVAVPADSLEGWQALWNKKFAASLFPAETWPKLAVAELSQASLKSFDRAALPVAEVRRADNSPLGSDVTLLSELAPNAPRWLSALAAKPAFPVAAAPAAVTPPVKLDLSKQQDLGTLLQNGDWPAGTVLEVTGSGLKPMTPVKLVDKSWKIVWRPQDGAPLMLAPKSSSGDFTALITVERGSLELENLRFQMSAAKKSSLTTLIAAQGARLSLENVWLQGVMTDGNTLESVLRWTSGPPAADGSQPYLACQDCVFAGSGALVRLDLGSAPAFLRNCLLASRGDALDIRFGPLPTGQPAGPLVADHLTISAAVGALRLRGATGEAGLPLHRFYFDQCVFAPPMAVKGEEKMPTLVSLANPDLDPARVEWWGTANGVAPEIPSLMRNERDAKPNLDEVGLPRWKATWGDDQDARFLLGSGGVVMAEPTANKSATIKPTQFALHPKAKANGWDDGRPIGANLKQLELPAAAPKPKDPKNPVTPPKPPGKTQPDF